MWRKKKSLWFRWLDDYNEWNVKREWKHLAYHKFDWGNRSLYFLPCKRLYLSKCNMLLDATHAIRNKSPILKIPTLYLVIARCKRDVGWNTSNRTLWFLIWFHVTSWFGKPGKVGDTGLMPVFHQCVSTHWDCSRRKNSLTRWKPPSFCGRH